MLLWRGGGKHYYTNRNASTTQKRGNGDTMTLAHLEWPYQVPVYIMLMLVENPEGTKYTWIEEAQPARSHLPIL